MIVLVLKFFQKIFNSWAYCFSKYFFHIWRNFILREDQTFLVCFFSDKHNLSKNRSPLTHVCIVTSDMSTSLHWGMIIDVFDMEFSRLTSFHLNYDKHDLWFLPFSSSFSFKIHHSKFKIPWKFFISLLYDKILIQFSLQIFHYKLI